VVVRADDQAEHATTALPTPQRVGCLLLENSCLLGNINLVSEDRGEGSVWTGEDSENRQELAQPKASSCMAGRMYVCKVVR
jgi:hypothetical protein